MPRSHHADYPVPVDRKAHTPAGVAFTKLVFDLFRLNGRMIASGDRMGVDLGMTSARWQVLGAVGAEPKTVAAAARAMGLTRQNVQRIADWLVESGLADYVDNPHHRRAKLVALTPKGVAMRLKLHRRQVKWANEVGEHLTVKELEAAIDVLKRLQRLA
jgi:DNA-binding MarR family transcriptional regulator